MILIFWGVVKSVKVPEGHHPRGTTLREALRGNLPLRGLCGGLSEGSAGSLWGFCGGPRDFPRFFGGSDPIYIYMHMLVTLGNGWKVLRLRKCWPPSTPETPKNSKSLESHFRVSVHLPTIQSETWLFHAKVREPHLNPPVHMNLPGFSL